MKTTRIKIKSHLIVAGEYQKHVGNTYDAVESMVQCTDGPVMLVDGCQWWPGDYDIVEPDPIDAERKAHPNNEGTKAITIAEFKEPRRFMKQKEYSLSYGESKEFPTTLWATGREAATTQYVDVIKRCYRTHNLLQEANVARLKDKKRPIISLLEYLNKLVGHVFTARSLVPRHSVQVTHVSMNADVLPAVMDKFDYKFPVTIQVQCKDYLTATTIRKSFTVRCNTSMTSEEAVAVRRGLLKTDIESAAHSKGNGVRSISKRQELLLKLKWQAAKLGYVIAGPEKADVVYHEMQRVIKDSHGQV